MHNSFKDENIRHKPLNNLLAKLPAIPFVNITFRKISIMKKLIFLIIILVSSSKVFSQNTFNKYYFNSLYGFNGYTFFEELRPTGIIQQNDSTNILFGNSGEGYEEDGNFIGNFVIKIDQHGNPKSDIQTYYNPNTGGIFVNSLKMLRIGNTIIKSFTSLSSFVQLTTHFVVCKNDLSDSIAINFSGTATRDGGPGPNVGIEFLDMDYINGNNILLLTRRYYGSAGTLNFLINVRKNGTINWVKSCADNYQKVIAVNGNYFLGGKNKIIRISSNGVVIWNKDFSVSYGFIHKMKKISASSFLVYGIRGSSAFDTTITQFSKLDLNGNIIWSKNVSPWIGDIAVSKNRIYFSGWNSTNDFFAYCDTNGVFKKCFTDLSLNNNYPQVISIDRFGQIFLSGYTYSNLLDSGYANPTPYIKKINPNSIPSCYSIYSIPFSNSNLTVTAVSPITISIATILSNNILNLYTNDTLFALSLCGDPQQIALHEPPSGNFSLQIYPNPSGSLVTIVNENSKSGTLKIYDFLGREMINKEIEESVELNISDWTSGVYFVLFVSDGERSVQGLIKE